MKALSLGILLIVSMIASAQSVEIDWQNSYGGIDAEESYDIIKTPDGNLLIVGNGGPYL